jgi:hypothetical protein
MATEHVAMDYELKSPPTQSRAFTSAHRGIIYSWIVLWTGLMTWFFQALNSQNGGWFDGPGFAALIAGSGLVAGLIALGIVVGAVRLAITDETLRTTFLILVPLGLLVWVLTAFSA